MKVLLTRDIEGLGKAGQVKTVADGYARNYLIPRGLAILASPGALKQAETIRKAEEKRQAQLYAEAQAIAGQLAETALVFHARAGTTGKLYGSITTTHIADAILSEKGITLDKRKIDLREPIRMVGEHKVKIKLAADVVAEVRVVIEAEIEQLPEEVGAIEAAEIPTTQPPEPEVAAEQTAS